MIASDQTGLVTLLNNLVVENAGNGMRITGNPISQTGATVDLYSSTIADNLLPGVQTDAYTSLNMYDNILAFNGATDAVLNGTVSEDYNVSTTNNLLAGLNDVYATVALQPVFNSAWYLANTSPAIGIDATRQAVNLPYLTANPYAQPTTTDTTALDAGYHHTTAFRAVSTATTAVTASSTNLTPNTNSIITVTPLDANSVPLGPGQNLSATITANGGTTGSITSVSDHGDGTYTFVFTSSNITGGNDLISIQVNGIPLNQTVTMTW